MLHEIQCDDVYILPSFVLENLQKRVQRPIKIVMASEAQLDNVLSKVKKLEKQGQQRTRQDLHTLGPHAKGIS
jgi:hypothetical protein